MAFRNGVSIADFMDDFPSVTKEQAVAVIEIAGIILNFKDIRKYMKLLLDENLPKKFKSHFPNIAVHTVSDMGWNG